jgi:hypothetical protein
MSREIELISDEQLQYLIFIGLSVGVAVLTGILYFRTNLFFQSYIGRINPLAEIIPYIHSYAPYQKAGRIDHAERQ